jgi:hypothetical protein
MVYEYEPPSDDIDTLRVSDRIVSVLTRLVDSVHSYR